MSLPNVVRMVACLYAGNQYGREAVIANLDYVLMLGDIAVVKACAEVEGQAPVQFVVNFFESAETTRL